MKQLRRTTRSCDHLFPIPGGSQGNPIPGKGFHTPQAKRSHMQAESHGKLHSQPGDELLYLYFISPQELRSVCSPLPQQLRGRILCLSLFGKWDGSCQAAQLVAFGFCLHRSKRNLLHGAEQCSVPLVADRSRSDSEDQGPSGWTPGCILSCTTCCRQAPSHI